MSLIRIAIFLLFFWSNFSFGGGQGISGGNPQFISSPNMFLILNSEIRFAPPTNYSIEWINGQKVYLSFNGKIKIKINRLKTKDCKALDTKKYCINEITKQKIIGYKKIGEHDFIKVEVETSQHEDKEKLKELLKKINSQINKI